jgi:hypothetical protein
MQRNTIIVLKVLLYPLAVLVSLLTYVIYAWPANLQQTESFWNFCDSIRTH